MGSLTSATVASNLDRVVGQTLLGSPLSISFDNCQTLRNNSPEEKNRVLLSQKIVLFVLGKTNTYSVPNKLDGFSNDAPWRKQEAEISHRANVLRSERGG